ncbi:MAG: VTT domain-containing protein [Planctomycetes bacterium]|nr:VTT domain-containing protein [Planctomycetota bacterium]
MNNPMVKPLLLVAVVLVLPLVAIAFWGESFREVIDRWQETPPAPGVLALAVVAILASDVFLSVPSGPVSTLAGSQLGFVMGTLASTVGMTVGAIVAFGLARRWGRPVAERFSSPEQYAELESACREHGPWMVILTRPLPVLAEASALLVGALQMTWRTFLPTVVVSNLLIAATYSALGQQSQQYGWLPAALCASVAMPLLVALWWRSRLRMTNDK